MPVSPTSQPHKLTRCSLSSTRRLCILSVFYGRALAMAASILGVSSPYLASCVELSKKVHLLPLLPIKPLESCPFLLASGSGTGTGRELRSTSLFLPSAVVTEETEGSAPGVNIDAGNLGLPQTLVDSLRKAGFSHPFLTMQSDNGAAFLSENLLTGEEAVVAAAAAEAVALAKAAADVAKTAALIAGSDRLSMENLLESRDTVSTLADIFQLENSTTDVGEIAKESYFDSETPEICMPGEGHNPEFLLENGRHYKKPGDGHNLLQMEQPVKVAVRSMCQIERRTRRERVADKASSNFISVKCGSSSRKKRSAIQEIDYSDPLRYLRGTTSTSRLLTTTEELELSEGIQDLLKLEKLHEELTERYGGQPTFAQWALAAGLDQKTLRKRLNYGILCKDKMIKSNIRLVISIAKNYQGAGMNLQDLVQEGCRGLVRGAEKFDASKGFKFSTYAHWWIKQAVRKSLSDQSRTIRLPFHMVEATYRVKEARKQLYSENGRQPNNEEVAEATGLSMKRLTAVLLTPKAPRSLDQKIGVNQNLKPSEVIADPAAESAEDILIKQFMKQDLDNVLDSLSPREKQVIRWRFGLEDGRMKTLQEIGELMGVSRERIRQIESCAFRKLKNKKRTKNLRQYLVS